MPEQKSLIDESRAEFVKIEAGGLTSDRLLFRRFPNIPMDQIKVLTEDLKLRTSSKNPPNKEKNFVDGPMAKNVEYDTKQGDYKGRWRNVRISGYARGEQGATGDIIQVLAEGLIQEYSKLGDSVLVGSTDRLISPHARLNTAEKEAVEVKYKALDADYAEAIKDVFILAANDRVQAQVRIIEDGSANLHVLTEVNTWVTATNASATEDVIIRDTIADTAQPVITLLKNWNNITQDSVNAIVVDPVAAWVTSTPYVIDNVVLEDSKIYVCKEAHTSGTFATDLAAGRWYLAAMVRIEGVDNLDGSGKVTMRLERLWDITDAGDLPTPLVSRDKMYPKKLSYSHVDDSYIETVVATYRRLSSGSLIYLIDTLTEADLQTNIDPYVDATKTLYKLVDKLAKISDDGTLIFVAKFERPSWANTTPTWVATRVENRGGYGQNITSRADGVPLANAAGIVASHTGLAASYTEGEKGQATVIKVDRSNQDGSVIVTRIVIGEGTDNAAVEQTYYGVSKGNRTSTFNGIPLTYAGKTLRWKTITAVYPGGYSNMVAQYWTAPAGGGGANQYGGNSGKTLKDLIVQDPDSKKRKKILATESWTVAYHATMAQALGAINNTKRFIMPRVVIPHILFESIKITAISYDPPADL